MPRKVSKRGRATGGRCACTLRRFDTAALMGEMERRRSDLEKQREAVREQPDEVQRTMAGLGGAPKRAAPARAARRRRGGYRSASPNFRSMVSRRLTNDGRFKRVKRGVYAIKGTAKEG